MAMVVSALLIHTVSSRTQATTAVRAVQPVRQRKTGVCTASS